MKTKLKYIVGSIVMGGIMIFSAIHPKRYEVEIPIIFGFLFILSVGLLISDKKMIEIKCPICGAKVQTYSFHLISCPKCDYDGSTFNPLFKCKNEE